MGGEGRVREGDSIIAFVRRFKGQGRIQARVGQRRVADGLGCVGEIIQVEVAGRVDARLAVGQGDVERLALSDVTEDLAKVGRDAEAVTSAFLHLRIVL